MSTSALKQYSKCTQANHEALEHLIITDRKNSTTTFKTISAAGLDYVKLKVHHSKRPIKTKAERNKYLSVRPKFIFKSGQHPNKTQNGNTSCEVRTSTNQGTTSCEVRTSEKDSKPESTQCKPTSKNMCTPQQDVNSRERVRKPNQRMNIQAFNTNAVLLTTYMQNLDVKT